MSVRTIEPLSYSSSNEILGCEQKYVFRKVQKVSKDEDAPLDTLAMDIGSTIHKCLEDCKHDLNGFDCETLLKEMKNYNVPEEHGPMLWAMLRKYKVLHERSGLKCPNTEIKLEDEHYLGFIDLVLTDDDGGWWITDLKTAASISKFLPSRLPMDRQLNIYAHKYVEKHDEKFKGCRYRVITKAKLKRRQDESFKEFADRNFESITAVEYIIPKDIMLPEEAGEQFNSIRRLQRRLVTGAKKPIRNYNYCDSYFRPCDYWSRCHGENYSAKPRVIEVKV